MAPAESFEAEPEALSDAVDFDRLPHVFRAGGIEAARRRQKGRDQEFVPAEASGKDARGDSLHLLKKRLTSS
jgi:hypothetical protein